MKRILSVCALLILAWMPSQVFGREAFVQVKGSDTMVNLGQAWAEVYMEQYPEAFIAVTGGGSGTGISSLISGTCDIAMCSRTIKEKEIALAEGKGIHPTETIVAMDGLVVVVHPDNPVDALTLEQLAAIFTGTVTNWKELGGNDEEMVLLSREVNSGTHVYFKEHVLSQQDEGAEFSEKALLMSSSQAIADEVAQNSAAIGYYGMGYLSDRQKAVAVAADESAAFVKPTIENVISGDYPISRPLFIYTNGEPSGQIKGFVDYMLSSAGQKVVLETDFVPVKQ